LRSGLARVEIIHRPPWEERVVDLLLYRILNRKLHNWFRRTRTHTAPAVTDWIRVNTAPLA